jgi:TRAP transporter TAXI family solute receptor
MRRALALLCALLAGAAPAMAQPVRARVDLVTVGAGPLRGTYYPVARAICRVVTRELAARNIRCSPEPTFGSVYNVQMMQAGELDFALVQADVQHQALNGAGAWAERPFRGLRSVFAVYDEAFVLVGAAGAQLRGVEDLRGRRVATGVAGSGTRATWDALAGVMGWQGNGRGVRSVETADIAAALCGGALDAAVAVGFQPIPAVRAELAACSNQVVPVQGEAVARLTAAHPYFRRFTIPAAAYGTPGDIETFGMSSDFVAAARTDPAIVTAVTRAVLDNIEELAAMSPALARLDRRRLATGLTAPLHPAAEAVYREAGLLR